MQINLHYPVALAQPLPLSERELYNYYFYLVTIFKRTCGSRIPSKPLPLEENLRGLAELGL